MNDKVLISLDVDIGFLVALSQAINESAINLQNTVEGADTVGTRPGYLMDCLWLLQFHPEQEVRDHYQEKIRRILFEGGYGNVYAGGEK